MTEAVFDSADEVEALFEAHKPAPLTIVDLANGVAMPSCRRTRILAWLSRGRRLTICVESYTGLDRDPTDAELMMFAQANSEHCRHKIFNASWVIDGQAGQTPVWHDQVDDETDPGWRHLRLQRQCRRHRGLAGQRLMPAPAIESTL